MTESRATHQTPGTRTIRPRLPPRVMQLINAVVDTYHEEGTSVLAERLRKIESDWDTEDWALELRAVAMVLADLLDQGWQVRPVGNLIELGPPGLLQDGEDVDSAKARLRTSLRVARSRQLAESGVRKFIDRMQRVVLRESGRTSIGSVIENGKDLAFELRKIESLSADAQLTRLRELVQPELQFVDDETKCSHSNLRVLDIWRYFRHTWSLEYRSIPGRQLPVLIRNRARPGSPVMGIAMLASPVVRMRVRDDWIGWTPEAIAANIRSGTLDQREIVAALYARLQEASHEIRSDDLIDAASVANPSESALLRLEQRSSGAAIARKRSLRSAYERMSSEEGGVIRSQRDEGKQFASEADLRILSEDPLYVQKRADTLIKVLTAKLAFQESGALRNPAREPLRQLLCHRNGLRALNIALQEVRKAGLSSQVADLSVCGAVAPYNALLGGKLVALLMASQEVQSAYRDRYANQPSIISSQMAGNLVFRPAELQVLTTTSLYGNGSSQYNRLYLKRNQFAGLSYDIVWHALARTVGYGTHHLAPATLRLLRQVSENQYGARRINNRFGEGSSPRLRQTREGLEALGIDAKQVMDHATPRLFYACALQPDSRRVLMGLSSSATPVHPAADVISDAWRERWLVGRISRPGVLEAVAAASPEYFAQMLKDEHPNQELLSFDDQTTEPLQEMAC